VGDLVTSLFVFANTNGYRFLVFACMIEAEESQFGLPETVDDRFEFLIERLNIIVDKKDGWEDENIAEVISILYKPKVIFVQRIV
jgi:hypothetical protein